MVRIYDPLAIDPSAMQVVFVFEAGLILITAKDRDQEDRVSSSEPYEVPEGEKISGNLGRVHEDAM